jgi:hypothetical protein
MSLSVAPAAHCRGPLAHLRRNRLTLVQARGRTLTMKLDRHRHALTRVGRGRRVEVRLSLDFAEGRVVATAGRGRATVRRTLLDKERLIVTGPRRCVRLLSITAGASTAQRPGASSVPPAPVAAPVETSLFAATSVWNSELPTDAPLDPASAILAQTLRDTATANLAARTGPWIQTWDYSTPVYRVPAEQPTVRVQLDAGSWATTLQAALEAVPIPSNAQPAAGTDGHLTIWQPSTDRLWELYRAHNEPDGWHADFGGAMMNVSGNPGYYTPLAWPGALSVWGATATSLPAVAGTMLITELQSGVIPHALAMAVPFARARVFSWPAQRTDGTSADPNAIPEGARFRIDPTLDLDALDMPPVTRMMAKAAQRYGMIVRDQTSHAIGFFAEDPSPTGADPYASLFGGLYPTDLLASFPWSHLQLLKMDLSSN